MLEDGKVRSEECICEPCSDTSPNWKDIRSEFGYTTLSEIVVKGPNNRNIRYRHTYIDIEKSKRTTFAYPLQAHVYIKNG